MRITGFAGGGGLGGAAVPAALFCPFYRAATYAFPALSAISRRLGSGFAALQAKFPRFSGQIQKIILRCRNFPL